MDVRQVISDIKVRVDDNEDDVADHYEADVLQVSDTYPFGWAIQSRSKSVSNYRYAFNGMENNNELGLDNENYDFGARMYSSAIGRWWSTDPLILQQKNENMSPYSFADNSPVMKIDPDGKDAIIIIDENTKTVTRQVNVRLFLCMYQNLHGYEQCEMNFLKKSVL